MGQENIFIIDSGVTKKGLKISSEDGIDATISNFNADERFSSKSGKEFLKVLNNHKGVIQSRLKKPIRAIFTKFFSNDEWWVWVDSNHRPHPYQGCALTKLSYRPVFQLKGILQPKLKR